MPGSGWHGQLLQSFQQSPRGVNVRIGGMVWFAAGFAFCLVLANDALGGVVDFVAGTVGAIVVFVLELGGLTAADGAATVDGMLAVFAVLALIGATLLIGRSWAERARGFHDADVLFNRRKNYRLPRDKRV